MSTAKAFFAGASVLAAAFSGCTHERAPRSAPDASAVLLPDSGGRTSAPLQAPDSGGATLGDGKLRVYFFNVGQGDAALVVSPSGRSLLIDGGGAEAASHLAHRLPGILQGPIDLVVLTHPHPDHLEGLPEAVRAIGARRFLDPGLPCTGPSCSALLEALGRAGTQVVLPAPDPAAPGEPLRIGLGGGAELTVFWPRAPVEALLSEGDPETNSLILQIEFGHTSVLFAGDAQAVTEEHLLRKRLDLRSTLLKVAAHGAGGATTAAFLQAVQPLAAVISAGPGNAFGAPAKQTLARLEQAKVRVFRTDLDGEIDAVSDGTRFFVTTERPAAGEEPGVRHAFPAAPAPPQHPRPSRLELGEGSPRPSPRAPAPPAKERGRTPFAQVIDLDGNELAADLYPLARVQKPPGSVPPPSPATGEARYVASKSGKVFHVPNCRAARRILPKNLITYRSRAEAAADRRPAEDCNP